jgi:uncharacterized protein YpiB (UPF0302 family)
MRLKKKHLGRLKAVSMNGIFLLALLLVIPSVAAQEQEESNFNEYKGVVVDAKTKKVLEFATVSISNSNISTISNTDGVFLLKVPMDLVKENLIVSYLGFANKSIPLSSFTEENMMINMEESFEKLPDVNVVEADPVKVIRKVLENRKSNIYLDPLIVKAFYRESIKKRKTYASLSEAVIDIYKQPFASSEGDYVKLDRARKSTDYRKIDTLVIKLQGGPYNNLSMDMIRNEDLFFSADMYEIYKFSFDKMINMDDMNVYVIDFEQRPSMIEPFYKGKLYVDTKTFALVKSVFSLNLDNLNKAKKFFVKKKPANADVIPTDTKYIVDYRLSEGKWHFSYSRIELNFKIDWDKKWFNSFYNIIIEMAVTDWAPNDQNLSVKNRDRMRRNVILVDEASGFADPEFWGDNNVIEPDKSIENAIKKIQRNYKKENSE